MIQLSNIGVTFGINDVLLDVTISITGQRKIGVVGRNGAGKSTLLSVIAGTLEPTQGTVITQKGVRVAWLEQEKTAASSDTVWQEAYNALDSLYKEQASPIMVENDIKNVLHGLGFVPEQYEKVANTLSLGWCMRLALAKVLLTDADIYLLDEPTNHLDIVTQQWLLTYLKKWNRGFLLVSHDRQLLEQACTDTLEIERGKAQMYRGALSSYLEQKERSHAIALATRQQQERELAKKEALVARFRASAARAKQAQSLLKEIERTELIDVDPPLPKVQFRFPEPPWCATQILTFKHLTVQFDGQTKPVFNRLEGSIQKGERVALVAPNGVGKTTLLRSLAGLLTPQEGTVIRGPGVHIGYFAQNQGLSLDQRKTIYQEIADACPQARESDIRAILGGFLFSGDSIRQIIGTLSGGQKNRVALAKLLLQPVNLLLLDEPTNHLDLYTKDLLKQALAAYRGTIVFVSHDADFIQGVATRIIELTPQEAISFPGSYNDWLYSKTYQESVASAASSQESIKKNNQQDTAVRKQMAQVEYQLQKAEKDVANALIKLESVAYGTPDYERATKRLKTVQEQCAALQAEWEALAAKIL